MDGTSDIAAWLNAYKIRNVEVIVPDMAGVARGKMHPVGSFDAEDIRLPTAVFAQTITDDYYIAKNLEDRDMKLRPDPSTLRTLPWATQATASVMVDCFDRQGEVVHEAPREVLRSVLAGYAQAGWQPVVAPELEFYLMPARAAGDDPEDAVEPGADQPLCPYGVDRLHELEPFFTQLAACCEAQEIPAGTFSQELGPGQFEVNFNHGDALALADSVLHFKRTVRHVARLHGMRASFLAKPWVDDAGSSMHIHQSVIDADGQNVFSNADGEPSDLFNGYLGGLQQYMPQALALFAPYANSYRRFLNHFASPINLEWAVDNRTVGLRVPDSSPQARRVENRLAGSDVNPYLVFAGTLACGYLGMQEKLTPRAAVEGSAYDTPFALHRHLYQSLDSLQGSRALNDVLGEPFVDLFCAVKALEYQEYQRSVSPWEQSNLMFSV